LSQQNNYLTTHLKQLSRERDKHKLSHLHCKRLTATYAAQGFFYKLHR